MTLLISFPLRKCVGVRGLEVEGGELLYMRKVQAAQSGLRVELLGLWGVVQYSKELPA